MRMSCNGCRVLRKGCGENCCIRPCLQWIKTPESQAHATVFLAKFYGRAGLVNLICAGPEQLRPAIFRSLLYEACGRIVSPIYGSVGLMWSGNWQLCQTAVEAVLKGTPLTAINTAAEVEANGPPLKAYDIRHVSKDENSAAKRDSNPVKARCRFRRAVKPKPGKPSGNRSCLAVDTPTENELNRSTSHESSLSHHSEVALVDDESKDSDESMVSVETAEGSLLFQTEPEPGTPANNPEGAHDADTCTEMEGLGLELTLGFEPVSRAHHVVPVKKRKIDAAGSSHVDMSSVGLGL